MKSIKIYIVLFFIMVVWGFNVSAIKVLVENFMPVTITSLRLLTASITVFIILTFLKKIRLPHGREWLYILGGCLLNVIFHHYFLSTGLVRTSATNAGLILGMGPLLTVIMTMIFFRKRPTAIALLGFLLGGIGVGITVLLGNGNLQAINLGDLDIFLSILAQAGSFLLINKAARTMNPMLLTAYMLFFGSVSLFTLSLGLEPNGIKSLANGSVTVWFVFLISGVFATGIGHMIYNYSIGQVGAAETSIFLNLNTFFSVLGAALFLNETILPTHFIGLIFIISGVLLGSGTLEALLLQRRRKKYASLH